MSFGQQSVAKVLNVKDFGARGNGITDDYIPIQKCIDEALKNQKSKVIFPPGKYIISKGLVAHYIANDLEISGQVQNNIYPTVSCINPVSVLSIRGYLEPESIGTVSINNLNIKGAFGKFPYSKSNRFVNGNQWYSGISVTDKKSAIVKNVNISDIYGEGLYISTTKQVDIPLKARFNNVSVLDCKVINCWGYNPKSDDYGDGIYIADVSSAIIKNNLIQNNFSVTKQLGRCGIVIEFMAENCIVSGNKIFGYDRGIHLEADYGNHTISQNVISGSDMGIVLFNSSIPGQNKPVKIIGNTVSNDGFPRLNGLKRTRDIQAISDRSLLNFEAANNSRAGSLIENNTFIISGNYDYFSNTIVNIKADGLVIRNNKYEVRQPEKLKYPILYNNYSNSIPANDSFKGIRILKFKAKSKVEIDKVKRTNNLSSATLETNL
ncbi:hypothetical protein TH53_02465 [Pedobacter lusitanus]|uniref:Right handed beta helix domain-containing protein n=1 Tax=Pedobacter lusitanus TaxID=1503925 RepID=A0A0D0FA09_9SPHI|nr:hypothetical protein TH53_02465 [Pedobacter lusitanus]